MPLPPALLERLKRRKIIKEHVGGGASSCDDIPTPATTTTAASTSNSNPSQNTRLRSQPSERHHHLELEHNEGEEEIIAEDYSDEEQSYKDDDGRHDHEMSNQGRSGSSLGDHQMRFENRNEEERAKQRHSCEESEEASAGAKQPEHQGNQNQADCDDELTGINHSSKSITSTTTMMATKTSTSTSSGSEGHRSVDNESGNMSLDSSILGCPNKYNIYHECSHYCLDKFGTLEWPAPTIEQRKQLALILKTFPLTNEWLVVYDPGVRSFYFWNTMTNLVSWLPPGLGAMATFSADQIRRSIKEMQTMQATSVSADPPTATASSQHPPEVTTKKVGDVCETEDDAVDNK